MKLNPKQLAASAALLGVLACAAALPASAAGPVTTPLALTLPKVSFPWDKVTAESIETGSYDAAPLAGTAQQLSPVTTPANAASKNGVTYVSDNPNVVSVDSEGVAQAVGLGTANITATCGGVSCTYTITPQPDASMIATEMDITLASSTIAVGETTSLSLAVLPTSAANYINVSLSSSNEKVATVNNFGKVTGVAPGKATITATDGNVSCTATVTVVAANTSTVSSQSISLNTNYVVLKPGSSKTITGKVSPASASQSFFDPVQHRQVEMDRQPHALHLLEVGQHVLLTLLRHIQIHFIQRCLPQPVHEIIEVRLDLHPIDLSVKLLRSSFQNGKAGHPLRPVLFQLFQNGACVLLRGHHPHKALNPLCIAGAYQHLFEDSMSARHHKDIDDGHKHQKIAGVQHGSLGQRQAGRINEGQQKIEPHRNFNFTNRSAVHDIFALIKCKKGQNIGQQQ